MESLFQTVPHELHMGTAFLEARLWPVLLHLLQIILLPCAILAFSRSFFCSSFAAWFAWRFLFANSNLTSLLDLRYINASSLLSVLGLFLSGFWSGALAVNLPSSLLCSELDHAALSLSFSGRRLSQDILVWFRRTILKVVIIGAAFFSLDGPASPVLSLEKRKNEEEKCCPILRRR